LLATLCDSAVPWPFYLRIFSISVHLPNDDLIQSYFTSIGNERKYFKQNASYMLVAFPEYIFLKQQKPRDVAASLWQSIVDF
jgi:hypothetical protein